MESELESLVNKLFGRSRGRRKSPNQKTQRITIYCMIYLIGYAFFMFFVNQIPATSTPAILIILLFPASMGAFVALFVFVAGFPSLIPWASNTKVAIIIALTGLTSLGVGTLLLEDGPALVLGLIGGFVFIGAFLIPRSGTSTPTEARELMKLARQLGKSHTISGQEYGKFIVTLEKTVKRGLVMGYRKQQIIETLHNLMLERQPRISGSDYVELEKELQQNREAVVYNEQLEIFSEREIKQTLDRYERLREKIRDRRLEGEIEP